MKNTCIFFDLETSDLHFCGQILNYSFVHVDENWNVLSELNGDIRLSRLQLPSPGAILANGIDVVAHQKNVQDTEPEALEKIWRYLENITDHHAPVRLIGFNSTRFDVPFLRTSMIRNGFNPYFGSKLEYGDVLFVAQKLATYQKNFQKAIGAERSVVSLRLEKLCQDFGLRKGPQSHSSREDVDWTIALARHLAENFDEDVRTFDCYEPPHFGVDMWQRGWTKVFPVCVDKHHIDETDNKTLAKMALLVDKGNQALWVDLEQYARGARREAVYWYNKTTSPFFVESIIERRDLAVDLEQMRKELSHITLENFFPPKNCDIEQFIYSMKFIENKALAKAIHYGDLDGIRDLQSRHASILYLRYVAAYMPEHSKSDDLFRKYVMYRYGGQLKLSKNDFDTQFKPGVYSELFHMTYNEYFTEIDTLKLFKPSERNFELLDSLKTYLNTCQIATQCRGDLSKIWRQLDGNSIASSV